jgi:hypothetical protein
MSFGRLVAPRTRIRVSLVVVRPSQRVMNSAFLQVGRKEASAVYAFIDLFVLVDGEDKIERKKAQQTHIIPVTS